MLNPEAPTARRLAKITHVVNGRRRQAVRFDHHRAYYSENDPKAAAVLEELVRAGVVAPGDVDMRSITEVRPDDLEGYTQCHFFAGGGLWSIAARQAGWPDRRPLWTGSCPCQPFSAAGRRRGAADPRHLWPHLHRLIRARRPAVVMGEQVAGKAGYGWFDGVRADLARERYASRCVDIPACAVNAPHQRNRLYWIAVAYADGERKRQSQRLDGTVGRWARHRDARGASRGRRGDWQSRTRIVGDALGARLEGQHRHGCDRGEWQSAPRSAASPDGREPWQDATWIRCHDGKARRAQPAIPLLADGIPGRMGLWRLAGNAIVPRLAAEVISAYLDCEGGEDDPAIARWEQLADGKARPATGGDGAG